MSCCQYVPDHVLEQLGDRRSIELSKALRSYRSAPEYAGRFLLGIQPAVVATTGKQRTTYTMDHRTKPRPGVLLRSEGQAEVGRAAADEAHDGAGTVYDFYKEVLGRRSLDDHDMLLQSIVEYGDRYNNAYWNGKEMTYGDGDGELFVRFTKSLEVIAHEMTHGVVTATCDLNYWGESGALNESFADVFGIACQHWAAHKLGQFASWLIGDEIVGPKFPGRAIRNMDFEPAYKGDDQPKHIRNKYRGIQDNGGVHINSGIPNYAFFLTCQQAGEPPYGTPLILWYEVMQQLPQFCNFATFARALRDTAQIKHPILYRPVHQALKQVGL